jgi:hypothetical protein
MVIPQQVSTGEASLVLFCLICKRPEADLTPRFLLHQKQGQWSFPATKFRVGENLYGALVRPMQEDLGLPAKSYFAENELEPLLSSGETPRYPGLTKNWHLYPVVVSLEPCGVYFSFLGDTLAVSPYSRTTYVA